MDKLKDTWLTDGLIDFEYKKYILLAYLKRVKASFGRVELYPQLADLFFHYRNLQAVRDNKTMMVEQFPKELSLDNLKALELSYRKIIEDDAVMAEIESIMEFAIPKFREHMNEGTAIYDFVESNCELTSVGVVPLYAQQGYLFITQPPESETHQYRYQVTVFQSSTETMRGLQTEFIGTSSNGLSNTYEHMKRDLIRQYQLMPNPATYLIISKMKFPYQETLVPVAKRLLVKHLTSQAA